MKSVLISGSKGFIGKHLINKLINENYQVIEFDGDIQNKESFDAYNHLQITHYFHLAAKSFVPDSWHDPDRFFQANVCGVENALEYCRKNLINATFLSSYLYGEPLSNPINEKAELKSFNPYALTKLLGEKLCEFYGKEFNLNITVIRPFNVYGPGQSQNFLIPELLIKILNKEDKIEVKDLRPKRDYIYVNDLVELLFLTINKTKNYQVFNAGSGVSTSVEEVIQLIMKEVGISKKIISGNVTRKNEVLNTVADISKANIELQWKPKISLEEGIKMIVRNLN